MYSYCLGGRSIFIGCFISGQGGVTISSLLKLIRISMRRNVAYPLTRGSRGALGTSGTWVALVSSWSLVSLLTRCTLHACACADSSHMTSQAREKA